MFTITLVEATGGASIGDDDSVVLSVVANDQPFGVVSVSSDAVTVDEESDATFTIDRT